ncbi:response regulator transcription factor [Metabacillus sp. Hm71]|uniref:response regulator transcription factor n=1 Tax=Metabacillus sp. Hm71 TaxID=3450743 RepID=UPI003F4236B2
MYKVIIVDDEPMIREGLRTLIPWEESGFQVIDIAKNGRDALEKYKHYSPDLMIVDIRMPEMDGLRLIEKIREENKYVHFIILSGYADFDYAKKALGCQCDGYLLKPLDEDELIDSLGLVHKKLQDKQKLHHLMEDDHEKKKEEFLTNLLMGNGKFTKQEFDMLCQRYGFTSSAYQVFMGSIKDHHDVIDKVKTLIEKENRGYVLVNKGRLIILFKDDFLSKYRCDKQYLQLLHVMEEFQLLPSIGEKVYKPKDIHHSYKTAARLLERKFFHMGGPLITSKEANDVFDSAYEEVSGSSFPTESYVERLYYSIDIANIGACEKIVNELVEELIGRNESEQEVKKHVFHLYTAILNKLLLANPKMHSVLYPLGTNAGDIFEMDSIVTIKEFILKQFKNMIKCFDNGQTDVTLKKMIDLIHKEFNQNLRLETLAEVFNYNSAYLGKLFKNHTGEYFNTYLDKVRIENGKQLLLQGYKVYEVAEKIGYANVDYFHRKFKKYVGLSPSSFRKEE